MARSARRRLPARGPRAGRRPPLARPLRAPVRGARRPTAAATPTGPAPPAGAPVAVRPLLDLYAPLCVAQAERPLTIAHLGQSLDGYIATASGDSYYVTGPDNVRHLHRPPAPGSATPVG